MTLLSKRSLAVLAVFLLREISAQFMQSGDTCRILALIPFTDLRRAPVPEEPQQDAPGGPQQASNAKKGNDRNKSSYGYGEWPDAETLAKASFSMMAAAEMARRHFNARDTSVVPELRELHATCNITMPEPKASVAYINSAYNRLVVVQEVLQGGVGGIPEDLCSIVGPVDLLSISATALVTEKA